MASGSSGWVTRGPTRIRSGPRAGDYYRDEWTSATNAALNLFRGMEDVFRYVEPRQENLKAFGHEIRQFLVLACTEVEAQCKAVLRANGYAKNGNLNMLDYFKLAKAMRLHQWQVTLARYPHLGWFFPFRAGQGECSPRCVGTTPTTR